MEEIFKQGYRVKKIIVAFLSLLLLSSFAFAQMQGEMPKMSQGMKMPKDFRFVPKDKAQILQSGKSRMFCSRCGMTLHAFYRTNHAAKVDGKMMQFCSLYCLVETMNSGKKVADIQVVDNTTLKFISVNKAFYVVGSSKPATMAKDVSKYAFGTKEAAQKFAKEFGGKIMNFQEALALAKKDFQKDSQAKKMRQAKMVKMGAKIYKKKCKLIEKKFTSVAEAKTYIINTKSCGNLMGKPLQAVSLYLLNK